MLKLLVFVLLYIPSMVLAADLYAPTLTGTEPPDNWSISYAARPTEMTGVTFTASGGIGQMVLTASTNTNAKIALFDYPAGTSWENYSMEFTLAGALDDDTTTYHWGVYYSGSGASTQCRFLYISALSTWRLLLGGVSVDYASPLDEGDVIKVYKYGNDLRMFVNGVEILTTISTTTAGTIYFGLQRTLTGSSLFEISNLVVAEATPFATATPTITPTVTVSPTISATSTASPYVTATNTPIPWYPRRVATAALPGQPQAICAYNNKLWVTINEAAGKLLEINPSTLAIEHTVTVGGANAGGNPQSVHGAFGYLWVGNTTDYTMTRVDMNTYAAINFGNWTLPNMITDDGTYIYLACQEWGTNNDLAVKINPSTLEIVNTYYLGGVNGNAYGICVYGNKLFVGRFFKHDVVVVDTVSNTILATVTDVISSSPSDIIYANGSVWVTSWGVGVLWKINTTNYSVSTVPLNFEDEILSWVIYGATSGGGYIWTTDYEAGRLHKVHPYRNVDVGWGDCSMNPQGVAYYNGFVYTTDAYNHDIVKLAAGEDYPFPVRPKGKSNFGFVDSWKKNIKEWLNRE